MNSIYEHLTYTAAKNIILFYFYNLISSISSFFYSHSVKTKGGVKYITYYDEGKEYIMLLSPEENYCPVLSAELEINGVSFDVTETIHKLLGTHNNCDIYMDDLLEILELNNQTRDIKLIILNNDLDEHITEYGTILF